MLLGARGLDLPLTLRHLLLLLTTLYLRCTNASDSRMVRGRAVILAKPVILNEVVLIHRTAPHVRVVQRRLHLPPPFPTRDIELMHVIHPRTPIITAEDKYHTSLAFL